MSQAHRYRLIVFDVDGTLVDSQHGIVAAMHAAFAAINLPVPPAEAVRRVVGLSLTEAVGRLLPDGAGPDLLDRATGAYKAAFKDLRHQPDYHEPLFPGVRETLSALNTSEVCLGIATGKSRRGLAATLARHGLDRHFVTHHTADGGPGKPHPRMLSEAMAAVGADPTETVLIGDTVFDMEMARNAGSDALGVAWGYHPADELAEAGAASVLESFDGLIPTLAHLRPGESGA